MRVAANIGIVWGVHWQRIWGRKLLVTCITILLEKVHISICNYCKTFVNVSNPPLCVSPKHLVPLIFSRITSSTSCILRVVFLLSAPISFVYIVPTELKWQQNFCRVKKIICLFFSTELSVVYRMPKFKVNDVYGNERTARTYIKLKKAGGKWSDW
jgi:hypothetical protein